MEFNCHSLSRHRALNISMENPEIPGRIKMERFIPVEIFRKKVIPFEVLPFFPFLPKRPKYSVPFVWITSARLQVERKRTICRYFVNGTTQSRSCFRCQKNTSTIWRKIFTEISVQMVSAHSIIEKSLDTWNVTRNAKQRRTNKSWLFFSFSGLCPFLPFLNCS